jgi:hypothetical protein
MSRPIRALVVLLAVSFALAAAACADATAPRPAACDVTNPNVCH